MSRVRIASIKELPPRSSLAPVVGNSKKMARPKGFEPLTPRFVVWCSIQLSYGRARDREAAERGV